MNKVAFVISMNYMRFAKTYMDLTNIGFKVQRIEPVHKTDPEIGEWIQRFKRKSDIGIGDPSGPISLTLTHFRLWKESLKYTNQDYMYIFEDDAYLQPSINNISCILKNMEKTQAPMLHLGLCATKYKETIKMECGNMHRCTSLCNHAYAIKTTISNQLAHKILNYTHTIALHGHPLYRYNQDVKIRGFFDHQKTKPICKQMFKQRNESSTSGHSTKGLAWR